MKQKDLGVIVAVVVFSAIVSFLLSSKLISTPSSRETTIQTVSTISPNFNAPSSKYFNSQSVDPTQLIQISNNSNQTPFNNTSQ